MTTFEERERAFEAKYAHDEEFRFRLAARRDKLFAHWAAERLGMTAEQSAALTGSVLAAVDGPGHDERVLAVVRGHSGAPGLADPDLAELSRALLACADKARVELLDRSPSP